VGSCPINYCQIHIITVIIDVRNFRTEFAFGSPSTWVNLGGIFSHLDLACTRRTLKNLNQMRILGQSLMHTIE